MTGSAYFLSVHTAWYMRYMHAGGACFLYDRSVVRLFRSDGHSWRKKPDGRAVRETHEKLKV